MNQVGLGTNLMLPRTNVLFGSCDRTRGLGGRRNQQGEIVSNAKGASVEMDQFVTELVDACLWAYNFGYDECINTIEWLYSLVGAGSHVSQGDEAGTGNRPKATKALAEGI